MIQRICSRFRSISRDNGFTLPELLVYTSLLVVVLGIVGGVIASMTMAQKTVSSYTSVSSQAQIASDSITTGIRNSSAFRLDVAGGDQVVQARIAQGTASTPAWVCAAWYYSAASHTIRFKQSSAPLGTITSTAAATWKLLASNVKPVTGTTIFTASAPVLAISFLSTGTNSASVQMTTSVRATATWTGDTCFTA